MRRKAKVDTNQKEITKKLRSLGFSVALTHHVGKGFPDLIIGFCGVNVMIELKSTPKSKLTEDEKTWHRAWLGQVDTASSFDQCLARILDNMNVEDFKVRISLDNVILIDGPRASGKSTICLEVVEMLKDKGINAVYFKKGPRLIMPDGEKADYEFVNMIVHLEHWASNPKTVFVADRFAATEYVMTKKFRRTNMYRNELIAEIMNSLILENNLVHAIITASADVLDERIKERGTRDWDVPKEDVEKMWLDAAFVFDSAVLYKNEEQGQYKDIAQSIVNKFTKKG